MDATRRTALLGRCGVFAAYLLVAVILTFPLVARFTTHVPSPSRDQDVFVFLWNNWWIHHAITNLHSRPYVTNFIMAPFVIDLRLSTLGLLYGLLSIPLFDLLGPVLVLNIQVLLTAALNGYATFKLSGYLARNDRVAFLAGLLVASTPAITFHLAVGRPSCAALWPVIFAMYFFLRLIDGPDNRTAAWLAISGVAALMADQQAAMFGLFWFAILAAHAAMTRRPELLNRRFLARIGAISAVLVIPAWVLYSPFVRTTGYTVPGAAEALNYSYPISLLWTPSMLWRAYGFLLPLMLIVSLVFAKRVPALVPWVVGAIAFVILSLGPVVGGTAIPLPFSLVRKLPALGQFRTPYRFQIPAAIGLAVGSAIVISWLLPRMSRRSGALVLVGCTALAVGDLLAFRVAHGFEMQTMNRDPIYDEIARDSRDCLVLEVPVGVRTGTDRIGPGEALSFHQSVHRKRLVNGSTSRMPVAALVYYRSSPAIMYLAGEQAPPGDLAADLERRFVELNVGQVVVHPEMVERGRLTNVLRLLNRAPGLVRVSSDSSLIAYRRDACSSR